MTKHKIPAALERGALYAIIALLGLGMILLIVQANDQAEFEYLQAAYYAD